MGLVVVETALVLIRLGRVLSAEFLSDPCAEVTALVAHEGLHGLDKQLLAQHTYTLLLKHHFYLFKTK